MVVLQDPGLNLNGFDAMMNEPNPDEGWRAYAFSSADGTDFGDPEVVITAIASQLADGDLENIDRYGNREATFYIGFTAEGWPDEPGAAIALGQQALELALRFKGWAPLTWVDPLAGAETSVMEMTSATVSKEFDDEVEIFDGMRVVKVTVHARPFVRPTDEIVFEAPPAPGSTPPADVTIDSGSSTTGWSGGGNTGTVNTVGLGGFDPFLAGTVYAACVRNGPPVIPFSFATRSLAIVADTTRPFLRIEGKVRYRNDATGHFGFAGTITVSATSPAGGSAVTLVNLAHDQTTGVFTALVQQDADIASLTIRLDTPTFFQTGRSTLWVAIDSIDQTAGGDGVFTGKVQSRQVQIFGSQRTEVSLAVLGLDDTDTPVALGPQTLVHTASAGTDGRAKFLGCRAASGLTGTTDAAATTGAKNTLSTTASPTVFTFPVGALLPGEFDVFVNVKGTAATRTLSYAATLDGAGSLDASDPVAGWYTAQVAVVTGYRIVPLGVLMLPPADIEDPDATISVKIAADAAVDLDEIWLAHRESGQVTLLDTNDSGISAVRLDAATVDAPAPSAWVGVATTDGTGAMMAAGARIQAFDQHMAEPGLLQISTVTPGCSTSRVSGRYFPRNGHDVAPRPS
ncbi:hypothetical protein JCM18899A_18850 [Nocardioides sp. AN3]